jgi:hypothetical protein
MSLKNVFQSVKDSFRFKKEITIRGIVYEITVLNMGQERKVNLYLDNVGQEDTLEYLNELRRSVVAEAITAINGEVIGKTVIDTDSEGKEVEKDKAIYMKELLKELPSGIVTEIFDAYIDTKDQSDDILKKEMKYDWFKTPEQRDRESEDQKKKEEAKVKEPEVKEPETKEEAEIKFRKVNEANVPEMPQ